MSLFGKKIRDYARFTRTGMILIVIYGIAITTSLMVPNYFHPPSEPIGGHIGAHLLGAAIEIVPLSLLAGFGFAWGRRRLALKSRPA